MNTKYFGNLEEKLKTGVAMAQQHNAYAKTLFETTGQILPRYDLVSVQRSILNAHRKFYGIDNKYDGKGNLIGAKA